MRFLFRRMKKFFKLFWKSIDIGFISHHGENVDSWNIFWNILIETLNSRDDRMYSVAYQISHLFFSLFRYDFRKNIQIKYIISTTIVFGISTMTPVIICDSIQVIFNTVLISWATTTIVVALFDSSTFPMQIHSIKVANGMFCFCCALIIMMSLILEGHFKCRKKTFTRYKLS